MKRVIKVGLAAITILGLLMLGGCQESSVKKFVSSYYSGWDKGNMTPEKSYDETISATSKELLKINKDQYVADLTKRINEGRLLYKSIDITSVTSYNDHIYRVKGNLNVEQMGQRVSVPVIEYVINEEGKYKFLQYGVDNKELTETNFNSESFGVSMDILYTGPDRVLIHIIAKNPTTSNYAVGFGGDAKITVETDAGVYEQNLPGMNMVRARQSNEGLETIEGVKGTVKKVTLSNVYELDVNNEPKDKSNSRSYILYEKK